MGVLEAAVRDHGDADIHQAWAFWVRLSHLARASGDVDLARTHLVAAQRHRVRRRGAGTRKFKTVDNIRPADDFLEAYEEGAASAADLRLVADFRASVLLSRRLAASTLVRGGDAVRWYSRRRDWGPGTRDPVEP